MCRIFLSGLIFAMVLALDLQARAEAPDLKDFENRFGGPVLWVPRSKTPPVIDGKLDDACWNDAQHFLGMARDNTVTAFYRVHGGKKLLTETQHLSARVKTSAVAQVPITIVAVDYFGNASEGSEAAAAP
jgi:hypothetical protein